MQQQGACKVEQLVSQAGPQEMSATGTAAAAGCRTEEHQTVPAQAGMDAQPTPFASLKRNLFPDEQNKTEQQPQVQQLQLQQHMQHQYQQQQLQKQQHPQQHPQQQGQQAGPHNQQQQLQLFHLLQQQQQYQQLHSGQMQHMLMQKMQLNRYQQWQQLDRYQRYQIQQRMLQQMSRSHLNQLQAQTSTENGSGKPSGNFEGHKNSKMAVKSDNGEGSSSGVEFHFTKQYDAPSKQPNKALSLHHELKGKGIGWNVCSNCFQRCSVMLPHPLNPEGKRWVCSQNVWNPEMATCCSEEEFMRTYENFLSERGRDALRITRVNPTIHGKPIKFWWLYNVVTQLGGWETVKTYGWLPLIYEDKGWTSTSIGHRLKVLYETHLLDFERIKFKGNRFNTSEAQLLLFRPVAELTAVPPSRVTIRKTPTTAGMGAPAQRRALMNKNQGVENLNGMNMAPNQMRPDSANLDMHGLHSQQHGLYSHMQQHQANMRNGSMQHMGYVGVTKDMFEDSTSQGHRGGHIYDMHSMERGRSEDFDAQEEDMDIDVGLGNRHGGEDCRRSRRIRRPKHPNLQRDTGDEPRKRRPPYSGDHPRRKVIQWNKCCDCGQVTSVEVPFSQVEKSERWVCSMNTWNPKMAHCNPREQWTHHYLAFMRKHDKDVSTPTISGHSVNLWWLYNVVTQMGGWDSVYENSRVVHVYKQAGWVSTSAANRIKKIYERYLMDYEMAFFRGKRYTSSEEIAKLERLLGEEEWDLCKRKLTPANNSERKRKKDPLSMVANKKTKSAPGPMYNYQKPILLHFTKLSKREQAKLRRRAARLPYVQIIDEDDNSASGLANLGTADQGILCQPRSPVPRSPMTDATQGSPWVPGMQGGYEPGNHQTPLKLEALGVKMEVEEFDEAMAWGPECSLPSTIHEDDEGVHDVGRFLQATNMPPDSNTVATPCAMPRELDLSVISGTTEDDVLGVANGPPHTPSSLSPSGLSVPPASDHISIVNLLNHHPNPNGSTEASSSPAGETASDAGDDDTNSDSNSEASDGFRSSFDVSTKPGMEASKQGHAYAYPPASNEFDIMDTSSSTTNQLQGVLPRKGTTELIVCRPTRTSAKSKKFGQKVDDWALALTRKREAEYAELHQLAVLCNDSQSQGSMGAPKDRAGPKWASKEGNLKNPVGNGVFGTRANTHYSLRSKKKLVDPSHSDYLDGAVLDENLENAEYSGYGQRQRGRPTRKGRYGDKHFKAPEDIDPGSHPLSLSYILCEGSLTEPDALPRTSSRDNVNGPAYSPIRPQRRGMSRRMPPQSEDKKPPQSPWMHDDPRDIMDAPSVPFPTIPIRWDSPTKKENETPNQRRVKIEDMDDDAPRCLIPGTPPSLVCTPHSPPRSKTFSLAASPQRFTFPSPGQLFHMPSPQGVVRCSPRSTNPITILGFNHPINSLASPSGVIPSPSVHFGRSPLSITKSGHMSRVKLEGRFGPSNADEPFFSSILDDTSNASIPGLGCRAPSSERLAPFGV